MHAGTMTIPRGDTHIEPGDDAIVISEPAAISRIRRLFGSSGA